MSELRPPGQSAMEASQELVRRVSSETVVRCDEPMAKRTTFRVGGAADLYVEPASEADLAAVLKYCSASGLPRLVMGRGSNLLVKDGGIRGVVICLGHPAFSRIELVGEALRCGAGAKLKSVAQEAKKHGLAGLEFLEGIPGTVGGGLRMNAGAMGGAMFDLVERVRCMDYDGNVREISGSEMGVSYRSCPGLKDRVALEATLRGRPDERERIDQRMAEFGRKRWKSQPAAASAGCIFKNPSQIPAGKLIEELGLKGQRVGGAEVSREHGNFLVNSGSASARDILDLIALIQERARSTRGIELETEVQVVGE